MPERRNVHPQSRLPGPTARRTWHLIGPGLTAAALLLTLPGAAGAQGEPIAQIRAIMAEKAARTDAERRLDSQLLLELRQRRGHALARAVPGLVTGIETDPDDTTLVEIKADVTDDLITRIESVGGRVLSQHRGYGLCRARVPLEGLEELAASSSV